MATKGQRTRREIVDAALRIFSVKGYFHTSISDVLEETGLTKGGLYGHFGSKEELWEAAYERAVELWQETVFRGTREIEDPLERVARTVENDLRDYIGAKVFQGKCFFFSMLLELAGQSQGMCDRILMGFRRFADLLTSWLEEADRKGILRPGVSCRETANFLLTSINGAAALYAAGRDPGLLQETVCQVRRYLDSLRAPPPGA